MNCKFEVGFVNLDYLESVYVRVIEKREAAPWNT
jgi:hypothetical protein